MAAIVDASLDDLDALGFGQRAVVTERPDAGFAPADAIAADGKAVLEFDLEETTLRRLILQAISRFAGTEQLFADQDLEDARQGAGFLAVRCPTDDLKKAAWSLIEPEGPLDARYYSALGIEHLAGDFKTN